MRSEEIYNRIQQIREEKNITVEELESMATFKPRTIYNFKTSFPSSEKILQLSRCLNVSCDYILTGKEFDSGRLDSFSEEYIARIFDNLNELRRNAALEVI
jgi:transcriptional regulator with XRE-family HTH domain